MARNAGRVRGVSRRHRVRGGPGELTTATPSRSAEARGAGVDQLPPPSSRWPWAQDQTLDNLGGPRKLMQEDPTFRWIPTGPPDQISGMVDSPRISGTAEALSGWSPTSGSRSSPTREPSARRPRAGRYIKQTADAAIRPRQDEPSRARKVRVRNETTGSIPRFLNHRGAHNRWSAVSSPAPGGGRAKRYDALRTTWTARRRPSDRRLMALEAARGAPRLLEPIMKLRFARARTTHGRGHGDLARGAATRGPGPPRGTQIITAMVPCRHVRILADLRLATQGAPRTRCLREVAGRAQRQRGKSCHEYGQVENKGSFNSSGGRFTGRTFDRLSRT